VRLDHHRLVSLVRIHQVSIILLLAAVAAVAVKNLVVQVLPVVLAAVELVVMELLLP